MDMFSHGKRSNRFLSTLSHPTSRAALFQAGTWVGKHMLAKRRNRRMMAGGMALKGLGAAVIAVPVGIWLGRKAIGLNRTQQVMDVAGRNNGNNKSYRTEGTDRSTTSEYGSNRTEMGTRVEGEENR